MQAHYWAQRLSCAITPAPHLPCCRIAFPTKKLVAYTDSAAVYGVVFRRCLKGDR